MRNDAHPDGPALSVVVVTRDTFRTLRPILAAIAAQTIAARLEVILVAPRSASDAIPTDLTGAFHATQVVQVPAVGNRGAAAAHGVRLASAPIVALSENHCFPEPDWAERSLAAHHGPWVGVGPAIRNANPESLLSRVMHNFGYGEFPAQRPACSMEELPLHNSSFRREVLDFSLEELEHLLANERRLHRRLREAGHGLQFVPTVVKWHINEATWTLLIGMWFFGGWGYGTGRAPTWPAWKRAAYLLASPLLVLPVAANVWRRFPTIDPVPRSPALGLVVLMGAACHVLGECLAYLGAGRDEFPFVEREEFLIEGRLGGHALTLPHVAALVSQGSTTGRPS